MTQVQEVSFTWLAHDRAKDKEVGREDYKDARDAENTAVMNGDRNFKGIGFK